MKRARGEWLKSGRLQLEAPLGEGAFGEVWKAVEYIGFGQRGELVRLREAAVKCLPPLHDERDGPRVIQEAQGLAELQHESILRLYDAFADADGTYLVTELATEGHLWQHFDGSVPTESELRELLFAVGRGLNYLHEQGYVHGDLKPENILVSEGQDYQPRYLIADFGLRSLIGSRHFQGTAPYIAPEAYSANAGVFTERSDVYALGVLLYEVASGSRLADALSDSEFDALRQRKPNMDIFNAAMERIRGTVQKMQWRSLQLPSFLGTILQFCLDPNPDRRPSAWGLMELWAAFSRSQSGVLQIDQEGSVQKPATYKAPFARVVDIEEDLTNPYGTEACAARLAAEDGEFMTVSIDRGVNLPMFQAVEQLKNRVSERPALVSFYNLEPLDIDQMRFSATRSSYAVVEPLRLIDVTELSQSAFCHRSSLHRIAGTGVQLSEPLMRGQVAHALFADMLLNARVDFDEAWEARRPGWSLDFAYLFEDDAQLERFKKEARRHFDNIKKALHEEPAWYSPRRHVESMRWSAELGLLGRVDAFFLAEGGRAAVYELKAGRVDSGDVFQLQAYAAMLSEDMRAAGRRPGETASLRARLLSSADGRMRGASPAPRAKLAAARNQAAHLREQLMEPRRADDPLPPDYPFFGYHPAKCSHCSTHYRFLHQACERSTALFGERGDLDKPALTPLEQDYFWHGIRLALIEEEAVRRQYLQPLLSAMQAPGSLMEVEIPRGERRIEGARLANRQDSRLEFQFEPGMAEFKEGDEAIAHRGDLRRWHETMRGTVAEASGGTLVVETHEARAFQDAADLPKDGWVVERFPRFYRSDLLRRALYRFISSRNEAMKTLVLEGLMPKRQGLLFSAAKPDALRLSMKNRLNAQQSAALLSGLDENGFLSITGPPGTGKTMTIHAIIETHVRQNARVLAAAVTNNAIDNIVERWIESGHGAAGFEPFFRFGLHSSMTDQFKESLKRLNVDGRRMFAKEAGAAFDSLAELRAHLESTRLLLGTAHSLLESPWVAQENPDGSPPFDLVIVDEATQMPEPLAAALLTLGKKAILVGDEEQLGPVCLSSFDARHAEMPESLREIGISGLDKSLFERLNALLKERGGEEGLVFLSRQYRMHPAISEWASEQFYGGRLETADEAQARLPELERAAEQPGWELLARVLDPSSPFVFLDIPGGSGDIPNMNKKEAEIAALLTLAMSRLGMNDVGCITPYRNQQAELRRQLRRFNLSAECGTVDAFQGREKTVVILSTARRDRLTSFLGERRRLNVSVTRARRKCVILGSLAVLRDHPLLWRLAEREDCRRERAEPSDLRRELGLEPNA